nr:hypothetical protein [Mesorhizobium amorphae]
MTPQGFAPLFWMIADRIEALLATRDMTPTPFARRSPRPTSRPSSPFNKLKNWRCVAIRYDKTKETYLGFVAIAAVKLWIPFVHQR